MSHYRGRGHARERDPVHRLSNNDQDESLSSSSSSLSSPSISSSSRAARRRPYGHPMRNTLRNNDVMMRQPEPNLTSTNPIPYSNNYSRSIGRRGASNFRPPSRNSRAFPPRTSHPNRRYIRGSCHDSTQEKIRQDEVNNKPQANDDHRKYQHEKNTSRNSSRNRIQSSELKERKGLSAVIRHLCPDGSVPKIELNHFEMEFFNELTNSGLNLKMMESSKGKKLKEEEEHLKSIFIDFLKDRNKIQNVYHFAFGIAMQRDIRAPSPKSFTSRIVNAFSEWLNMDNNSKQVESHLTREIQIEIFKGFVNANNMSVMKLAFKVGKLDEIAADEFVTDITYFISIKNYKKALGIIDGLSLYQNFPNLTNELLIPLILTNESNHVENFIHGKVELQKDILTFLDDLLDGNTVIKTSELYQRFPEVKIDSLVIKSWCGKGISKMISRYLTNYNITTTDFVPHYNENRIRANFRHHVKMKDDVNTTLENWRDLVENSIQESPFLKPMLVEMLMYDKDVGDDSEAAYWCEKFKMTEAQVSNDNVWRIIKGIPLSVNQEENWDDDDDNEVDNVDNSISVTNNHKDNFNDSFNSSLENEVEYHKLNENIPLKFIDRNNIDDFLRELNSMTLTGYDSEFRPNALVVKDTVATIQIASSEKAYVLDFNDLSKDHVILKKFSNVYFQNKSMTILGYGISHDLHVLAHTCPQIFNYLSKGQLEATVIDLESFSRRLARRIKLPFPEDSSSKGLSGLTERVLGLPLDKRNQRSDWNKRPLKKSQLEYAALDAFVLVEIYEQFLSIVPKDEKEVIRLIVKDLNQNKEKDATTQSFKEKKKESVGPYKNVCHKKVEFPSVSVGDVKVICDKMLGGLSKKLRVYGVDAVLLEDFEDIQVILDRSKSENRFILTKGRNYHYFRQYVPPGHCLGLKSDKIEDQINEIFTHFNVQIDSHLAFSRCTLCNSKKFININQIEMKTLRENYHAPLSNLHTTNYEDDDYDDPFTEIDHGDNDSENEFLAVSTSYDPWILIDGIEIHKKELRTRNGVTLKISNIPDSVLETQYEFYICHQCGHAYWQGSHWDKTRKKLDNMKLE